MKSRLVLMSAFALAACGGGGGSGNTSATSAAPAAACTGGPYTTDVTKVCTGANGTTTAYVYALPVTIIPDGTVITTDTAWTPAGSPYFIAGTVQLAKGVTLTVEDNTIVESFKPVPCAADCIGTIPTKGIIDVAGTMNVGQSGQAQLLGVTVSNVDPQTGGGRVSIQHTLLEDAFVQIGNAMPFSMTDSQAYRLNVTPIVRAGVTTYQAGTNGYPSFSNATVKSNTFTDSAAFAFDPSVIMQNNLFINMVDPLVLINAFPAGTPTGVAKNNSFLFKQGSPNTNRIVIESHGTYDASAVHTLDFSANFWGLTDAATIQLRVRDSTNTSNPRLPNVINFTPPATQPDPATPADPQSGTPNV